MLKKNNTKKQKKHARRKKMDKHLLAFMVRANLTSMREVCKYQDRKTAA
jgi:hypothetical protein